MPTNFAGATSFSASLSSVMRLGRLAPGITAVTCGITPPGHLNNSYIGVRVSTCALCAVFYSPSAELGHGTLGLVVPRGSDKKGDRN